MEGMEGMETKALEALGGVLVAGLFGVVRDVFVLAMGTRVFKIVFCCL